jgi:hypothetical protein
MTFDQRARADFTVERGILTKNRYGAIGMPSSFPDGCYQIVQIGDVPKKRMRRRRNRRGDRQAREVR